MRLARMILVAALLWVGRAAGRDLSLDLRRSHDLQAEEKGPGVYALQTSGADPYVVTQPLDLLGGGDDGCVLAFEYFCSDGVNGLEVFWGPPLNQSRAVSFGPLPKAETWQPVAVNLRALAGERWQGASGLFRLDFGSRAGVAIQVRAIQLRHPLEGELRAEAEAAERALLKTQKAERLKGYLEREYASGVDSVRVSGEEVEVRGRVVGAGRWCLAEVEIHENGWDDVGLQRVEGLAVGEFRVVLPRWVNGRDRMFSRWGVALQGKEGRLECASHWVYASVPDVSEPGEEVPALVPSKKGMGGVVKNAISSELQTLGVRHVTVNIDLAGLFRMAPKEGAIPYAFEGRVYGISRSALEGLDATMREFGPTSVVSAIVLVGFPKSPEERRAMTHPDSGPPGVYAMPNLTTEEGGHAYRAAIAFLAERYSGEERGCIAHWIVHNEVDYAHTWTNMGDQPMGLFMDQYVRSMRVVYLSARRWNPRANVFISLTHNWTTPEGREGRNYCVREMLERLVKYSKREGDFEWGVAYHPYPESLFQPAAWLDSKAQFHFDTELITPKNLEVLDAYMHLPEMLFAGKRVRRVLLSEQGFHTRDDGEEAQRLQAAALVYTWHKIRRLDSIEAFHYHRWIDHPGEGGLRVGLRTLPSPGKPFGERKFAWEVYAALDTPEEAGVTEFAKAILGVTDFDQILHRAPIGWGKVGNLPRK
jgi:hypothetical protein